MYKRVNESDVESGEKAITLQPGGENKMWSKIWIWEKYDMIKILHAQKMWKIWHDKIFSWSKNATNNKYDFIDK